VTYTCGMFGSPPKITCDGCGRELTVAALPPVWFLEGKAPPKWKTLRKGDGSKRWDLCATCLQIPEPKP